MNFGWMRPWGSLGVMAGSTALGDSTISHYIAGQAFPTADFFTRASAGWALNGSNVLIEYAPNVLREGPNGAWVEGARTNTIRNNVLANDFPTAWNQAFFTAGTWEFVSSDVFPTARAVQFTMAAQRSWLNPSGYTTFTADVGPWSASCFIEESTISTDRPIQSATTTPLLFSETFPNYTAGERAIGIQTFIADPSAGIVRYGAGVNGNVTGSLRLSLPSLELGAFASTPIVNAVTGGSTTRAAEQWNTPLGATAPTRLTIAVSATTAPGLAGDQVLWQADDGTEDDRITIRRNSAGNIIVEMYDGGVEQGTVDLGVVANSTAFNVAVTAIAGSLSASINGGATTEDTGGTFPTVTTGRTGHNSSTANHWFGTVSERSVVRDAESPFSLSVWATASGDTWATASGDSWSTA